MVLGQLERTEARPFFWSLAPSLCSCPQDALNMWGPRPGRALSTMGQASVVPCLGPWSPAGHSPRTPGQSRL